MRLKKEVSNFASSCEHLMAETDASSRKITEEEALLVEYYCREVLKKVVKRPPSQQESSGTSEGHRNVPSSEPKKQTISAIKEQTSFLH